jgi:hypothetical protein
MVALRLKPPRGFRKRLAACPDFMAEIERIRT